MIDERDVEAKFCKKVKAIGGWPLKFVSPGMSGVPDRLVLLPDGRACFAEIKKPGKTMRPLQKRVAEKIERLGFKVWLIDGDKAIEEFLGR